jgi:hypothetical protein
MTTLRPTITAAEVPAEWLASVAEVVRTKNYAVRPGSLHASIEVRAKDGRWLALQLPGDSILFTTAADRDTVLSQLL